MKYSYNTSSARKTIMGVAIIGMISFVPLVGFAKDNGKNGNDDDDNKAKIQTRTSVQIKNNDERSNDKKIDNSSNKKSDDGDDSDREENVQRGCFRAFGHLIAPGWIKHNDQFSFGDECNLPFGIGRKFRGDNSTTTPPITNDTVPPVISGVAVGNTAKTQVTVKWVTDERSDSAIFVSITSPVNTGSTTSAFRKEMTRDHKVVIKRLSPGTTYFAVVRSRDKNGNVSFGGQFSFTTKPISTDNAAPVINNIVTLSGTTTIQVGWHTNEIATSRVYFGLSPSVDTNASTTSFVDNATLTQNHLLSLNGLSAGTKYYMIIESADTAGNVSLSPAFSASTTAATSTIPVDNTPPVISNPVAVAGTSTIAVSWNTNETATSKVYFGTTAPMDISASTTVNVSNTSLTVNHSFLVTGLATSTRYYMVMESKDSSGNTATSSSFSVLTLSGI